MNDKRPSPDPAELLPTREIDRHDRASPGAFVRVFGERVFLAHPVPPRGALKIGRSDECDIVIRDHSVSRVHAILYFGEAGDGAHIEDAGSSNGTRVGSRVLRAGERCELPPGQLAELGEVVVVIAADGGGPVPLALPQGAAVPEASNGIVVLDDAMVALYRQIERVAGGDISVLLTGETGAGKEVLAERIHRSSPRRDRPLMRLNCAALTESLLESELFGHEKGAFTGAAQAKPGLLEVAEGGTVFLDELGEMALAIQAKLLRVIDERAVWRVGSLKARPIDVRFIAATNRRLDDEIARGRFRQDLYYRLGGVVLRIPPLRERPREIAALVERFVQRAAVAMSSPPPKVTRDAMAVLERYAWPGNVRELKNVVERAVLLAHAGTIGPAELGLELSLPAATVPVAASVPAAPAAAAPVAAAADDAREGRSASGKSLSGEIDALERQRILDMLASCGGNQSEAARRLGISRSTLIARLDRYGAPRPRKPGSEAGD